MSSILIRHCWFATLRKKLKTLEWIPPGTPNSQNSTNDNRRWSSFLDRHCCLVWQHYSYNSLDFIEYNSCSVASSSSSSLSSRNCSLKCQFPLERFGDFLTRKSSDEDVVSSAACAVETTIDSCAGVCQCLTSRTSQKSSSSSVSPEWWWLWLTLLYIYTHLVIWHMVFCRWNPCEARIFANGRVPFAKVMSCVSQWNCFARFLGFLWGRNTDLRNLRSFARSCAW